MASDRPTNKYLSSQRQLVKNGQRSLYDSITSLLWPSVGKLRWSAGEHPCIRALLSNNRCSNRRGRLPQVWLAVKGTPIVAKSYIETTPRSDGRNNTGLIAGVVASSLILLTVALGIGQVVFWPTLFNFVSGGVLMLPLTEAMFSVSLYLFILFTITVLYSLVVQCIYDLTSIRQTLYRHPDGSSFVYFN